MKIVVRRRLGAMLAVATCLVVVTACSTDTSTGEDDDGPAAAPSSGPAADGFAEAQELVDQWTTKGESIGLDQPVAAEIPTGKHILFMNCGQEICQAFGQAVDAAGKVLGWTTEQVNVGLTPESVQSAWEYAARVKPDGVVASGYPSVMFAESLATLEEAGIPVVECCVPDETAGGIIAMLGDKTYTKVSEAQAAWITVQTGGKGNVVFVDGNDYPITVKQWEYFDEHMGRLCPDCTVDELQVPSAEWGTTLPTKVVGYLRANPDVDYVALSYDGMAPGLAEALSAAGLEDVKFNGFGGLPVNKQYIADGKQDASVANPYDVTFWMAVDTLARHFTGESVDVNQDWDWPIFIYNEDNMDDPTKFVPVVDDFESQYATLWGKD